VEERILLKLPSYETTIEQQLHRALHELAYRQAARCNAALTPSQVLDIEVSRMPTETGR
jgi:hypothetical protein